MIHNLLKVLKDAFSSKKLRLPNKPLDEARCSKTKVEIWYCEQRRFPTGPTGCNSPNDPNYVITIPVSDVFYDPAVPAIGYTPLPPPPATLMNAVFTIDLYKIQRM
ncbi:20774_t:CDS:2, partial [Dentiscutata erythropus]